MTVVARFEGDARVCGDLQVDGAMPVYPRTGLMQDPNALYAVPLTDLRVWDALATNLPATGGTDDLGMYGGTFATNTPTISTGDVKNSTTTRYARFQFRLPAEYDPAQTVTLRLNAGMQTTVASSSATVDVECYKSDRAGGKGSDLCTTAAITINSLTFANKDFTITPTGLTAGDVLDVRLTIAITDSATGTAVTGTIGAIEFLLDIKG